MIAAMTPARVIGANNTMPWHLPADLKHFKAVTLGKPVVMGRKTYESIGRALPGRENIVITSQVDFSLPDATVVNSCEQAIEHAKSLNTDEIMVIGGGLVYQTLLPLADRLYLTFIDADVKGDTFFPEYSAHAYWHEVEREHREPDESNQYALDFVTLDRIK
ncbi:type 3 dihydrofolate reductase [Alteromonas facilis]|uniref:type 3 dihydrofolate reductase n=1 Tax=Alteromonas facilis TaxID=2048004 RepID=UPI000C28AC66|nr:type 3 dihydrofolate reductase [Alteromonas facilis]